MIRESLHFDVIIVGAGPAGLAAACRLAQLSADLEICIVEKGSEVGAHIVSGAVLETRALDELFPDWASRGAPVQLEVAEDRFSWLVNERRSVSVPAPFVPKPMRNGGNYIVSLGRLCRWLGEEAEQLGCHILAGFAATEILFDGSDRVIGVATGHKGIAADGSEKPNAEPGYELFAKYTVFAEGSRGSLTKALEKRFQLREGKNPQHYALGLKEIWEVASSQHSPGQVEHTIGWPLDNATEGGGFVYHTEANRVSLGLVVALNYKNPYLSPFEEFQRWKLHPRIRALLVGGTRLSFGARAISKGGLSSLPKLNFPGGLLIGCAAGFLNGAKIKGTHAAMKSGMLAAASIAAAIADSDDSALDRYTGAFESSWLFDELHAARNFSAAIARFGVLGGGVLAFLEHNVLGGKSRFVLKNTRPDHASLSALAVARKIPYPRPDGVISFDRLSSVNLCNVAHEENQPVHLLLADPGLPLGVNLARFDEPAQRYCPAAVYEVVADGEHSKRFQINAANCIHCKTCDIKDPSQNITWVPPEGGSGPNYSDM